MKLKRIALDLFFPPWCLGCGREGDFICSACRQSLPTLPASVCPRCGHPQPGGELCPACAVPSGIDGLRAPYVFQGVVRQAVHELKYRNLRTLATPLAMLLRDALAARPVPGDVLVPVPLHQRRLRERGYNQSGLLARELGNLTGMPAVEGCLLRRRYTSPQARTASAAERQQHMAGAFACRDARLRGRRVILLDDVATSGATLDAAAAALKAAGATSVWGLVVAQDT